MKRFFFVSIFFLTIACSSCGKKDTAAHKKLAKNYVKLAHVELSAAQAGVYHYKKALDFIEQALSFDKKAHYLAMKATLLFKLDQYDESCTVYDQALKCCDDKYLKAEITNNYACLLAQCGQQDKAIDMFERLRSDRFYLTPEVALVNLGKISLDKGEHQQAQRYFQQALALAPDYMDAHFYLALSAYSTHDIRLAKQEVKTILSLDPSCQVALEFEKKLMQT